MTVPDTADVVIVGAGPAGSALAIDLARRGFTRVTLIDRGPSPQLHVGESAAPHIRTLLDQLGLESDLERLGHVPYHGNLSVWGSDDPVTQDFIFNAAGHGWHLDRAAFDRWLRDQAERSGARLIQPAKFVDVSQDPAGLWQVTLEQDGVKKSISAPVIADAGGRRAVVTNRLNIPRQRMDGLVALAVRTEPAEDSLLSGRSFVEAVPDGWWYAVQLPDGSALAMLMSDDDLIRDRGLKQPSGFLRAWDDTSALKNMVHKPDLDEVSPSSHSCASQYAAQVVGPGWISLGDAMIGFDPLTSSGLIGALDDAAAAAETIAAWFTGDPLGARDAAKRYSDRAEASIKRYVTELSGHYRTEQRFKDHPFWQRRQG